MQHEHYKELLKHINDLQRKIKKTYFSCVFKIKAMQEEQ